MQYDVVIKVRSLQNYFVSRYLRSSNAKSSPENFAQANALFEWVKVCSGRSFIVIIQCMCWYVAIDENGNSDACKIFLSETVLGA